MARQTGLSLSELLCLLWERTHIFRFDRVQAPGVTSRWTQELEPIGARAVPAGELVELHTTFDDGASVGGDATLRFDVLEQDWFLTGGPDDHVVSLVGPGAPLPGGGVPVEERVATSVELPEDEDLLEAVTAHRLLHAEDYERGILVVRDRPSASPRRTHVIGWWRAQRVPELGAEPELYYVAEVGEVRDATDALLLVSEPVPGASVRLHGEIRDDEPASAANAQPVREARVAVGDRSTRTGRFGSYVLDVRLALGRHELAVSRSGIDTRRLQIDVSAGASGGRDVVVTDATSGQELARGSAPDDAAAVVLELSPRVRVHKLRGTVTWPDSRAAAAGYAGTPASGKRVYAVRLEAGATAPQRPDSTADWEALKRRPHLLRSHRPGRPLQGERTGADGEFELDFFDLSPGSAYLVWVESRDVRATDPEADAPEVVVRTVRVPGIREMSGDDASLLTPVTRHLVDSAFNLTGATVEWAVEALRVVDWEADPANPDPGTTDLRLVRPNRSARDDFDAHPIGGAHRVERMALDTATKRAGGVVLQALPLVPIDESPDRRSAPARAARAGLESALDADFDRMGPDGRRPGHLLGSLRWVLDLRRVPVSTPWKDTATAVLLDDTFLAHPDLPPGTLDDPGWHWWVIDTMALADTAPVFIPSGATYAGRELGYEWSPVQSAPAPRLLGTFEGRHLYLAPGHGLFAQPPLNADPDDMLSARGGWAARAGEDENAGVIAMEVMRIAGANGLRVTACREVENPFAPGVVQTDVNEFDVSTDPDFPRLWQLNAYYYIGHVLETPPPPNQIVRGGYALVNTANNATNRNLMRKNAHGIDARIDHIRAAASLAAGPIDILLAIHSDASDDEGANGLLTMYLDRRPEHDDPDPEQAGYVETNTLGQRYAELLQAWVVARARQRNRNGARSYWSVNGNATKDLTWTLDHHHVPDGAVRSTRARDPDPGGGLDHRSFPREIPVALMEVGFHTGNEDSLRLARRWFRRRVAEAMMMATEEMLLIRTSAVTREDVKTLLRRAFGSLPAVEGLPGGPADATPANIAAEVGAATGVTVAVPAGATLWHAVAAVETARDRSTRVALATAVRDALRAVAGYEANEAGEIDRFVARPVLGGVGIANCPRPDRPATRADAAGFVGCGIGVRPATPAELGNAVGGVVLMPATAAGEDERFVTAAEATALATRVARLRPQQIYRLGSVRATSLRGAPLPGAAGAVRVRRGGEVLLEAATLGAAWKAEPADITFRVRTPAGTIDLVGASVREPERLVSLPWRVDLEAGPARDVDVTVLVRHRRQGVSAIGSATVGIVVE